MVSAIDLLQQEASELRQNLLNIDSLGSLKQKLTKLIIVGLIVSAFKLMVSLEVSSVSDLLQFCGGVLMLAFSSLVDQPQQPIDQAYNLSVYL